MVVITQAITGPGKFYIRRDSKINQKLKVENNKSNAGANPRN